MLPDRETSAKLLCATDPDPVEVVNSYGGSDVLLVCEHAGRAVPSVLRGLGIPADEMERHIAYDIGAEKLARKLSQALHATLVLQRYSRLVIDCNRPLAAVDCVPESSDGTPIPMNRDLTEADRGMRFEEIHRPFHDAVGAVLDERKRKRRLTAIAAIHSFTPCLANRERPWQLGVCFNCDGTFARKFMNAFKTAHPEIITAFNEPYAVDDISDYTIPVHGERRGLPHVLLEVRNNEIADADGQERWAQLIAYALSVASKSSSEELSHGA